MKIYQIQAESAGRILNLGNKTYTFNKEALCNIPEEDISFLPPTYRNMGAILETEEITNDVIIEEVKKVVTEEETLKKVVAPKVGLTK